VAAITGIALATSPFLVTTSWIGSIDHHFLEPVFTFAILGATCLGIRGSNRLRAGILLGLAITAAMFVQTALLIAAALAFAMLFFLSDGFAATLGFSIAAIAVTIYRLTRAPGFPDNQWFPRLDARLALRRGGRGVRDRDRSSAMAHRGVDCRRRRPHRSPRSSCRSFPAHTSSR